MSETTTAAVDFAALFPEEVVTKALVRDVAMPGTCLLYTSRCV